MQDAFICQGRVVTKNDVDWLRSWIDTHHEWSRFRLAKELCKLWNWSTSTGRLKDFAARTFLRKLAKRNLITLPAIRTSMCRERGGFILSKTITTIAHPLPSSIETTLSELLPLSFIIPAVGTEEEHRFHCYLAHHHYLGFHRTVGENMKYLIRDRHGRELACLLFGAAAWKTKPRDQFIGWRPETCARRLSLVTNNTRFLILPWVRVPHLASHVLGRILRRIKTDWQAKYGHPVHLIETFVERDRFAGTCYKAANWIHVGCTKGRSRQDRYNTLIVPIKDIYLYPLTSRFQEVLGHENS